jgi:outer membrane lipoprotein-sorting protein
MNRRKATLGAAVAGVVAGAVALGFIAAPAGADPSPTLPKTTPDALVQSILTAQTPAMSGTVELDNNLGLPAVPGIPQAAEGTSQVRVWTDGHDRSRIALPTRASEQTVIDNGKTVYVWDSTKRTVVERSLKTDEQRAAEHAKQQGLDPATAAKDLVTAVRATSTVTVDGTNTVANRPAYDLVLTPKPDQRTLLREVRISVDAQTRLPLRLTVLADNTDSPALQIGFTSVQFGAQNPSLFQFTVPAGATVVKGDQHDQKAARMAAGSEPTFLGKGWDTVAMVKVPTGANTNEALGMVKQFGKAVHGSFGSGWVIGTDIGNALVTSDGRIAVGFVPQQVLISALDSGK